MFLWFFEDNTVMTMTGSQAIVITETDSAADRDSAYADAQRSMDASDVSCLGYIQLTQGQLDRLSWQDFHAIYVS